MPEIIVTIKTDGSTEIEGQNFKGNSCAKATEAIEAALGKVKSKKLKPEYYDTVQESDQIKIS